MKKRYWFGVCLMVLLLTGCGKGGPHLSAEEQQSCADTIDSVMKEFYWDYDKSSLVFSESTVPEKTEETEDLFKASEDSGYSLNGMQGDDVILAEATLMHYNGDTAGKVDFLFSGTTLSGVYYRGGFAKDYYSLNERNPFLANGKFKAYETKDTAMEGYTERQGEYPPEGYLSKGQYAKGRTLTVCIQNGQALVYRYANGMSRYRRFSYGEGLEATSAAFLKEDGASLAVLLSSITETTAGESEKSFVRSEKIMLYDENLKPAGEIPLESALCTAIGSEDGKLYVFIEQQMLTYENSGSGFQETGRTHLDHNVTQVHITDLDGDGVKEYLMTDGMDLYLYHHTGSTFRLLWSTHLGVENFYGPILSGDLNHDGVKEVYACDVTGTTVRYLLTKKGLRVENEDIGYGQCIYPCDFNADGCEDYWLVLDNEERNGTLFLGSEK